MQSIIVSGKNINSCNNFLEKYISEFAKENFQLSSSSSNLDFKNVDIPEGKKNIPMDNIRELIKWSSLKPSYKNHKIIVINADGLSIESQNALLKTVEEPPEYLQIIFKSSNYKQLLDTIISRCKVFEVENSSVDNEQNKDEIQKAFEEICSLKKMDLGQRIDWANEHKTELAKPDKTIEKFNMWIEGLRGIETRSFTHMSSSDSPKVRSEDPGPSPMPFSFAIQKIATLSDLIFKIKTYNLNPFLAVECFLVGL